MVSARPAFFSQTPCPDEVSSYVIAVPVAGVQRVGVAVLFRFPAGNHVGRHPVVPRVVVSERGVRGKENPVVGVGLRFQPDEKVMVVIVAFGETGILVNPRLELFGREIVLNPFGFPFRVPVAVHVTPRKFRFPLFAPFSRVIESEGIDRIHAARPSETASAVVGHRNPRSVDVVGRPVD